VEFRQKALARLQSPEELDVPVRLARPQGALVLALVAVVLATGGWWAVTGTVDTHETAEGVLTHTEGGYLLQSPYAGEVTALYTQPGKQLAAGAAVAAVRTADGRTQTVHAVVAGEVVQLPVQIGAVVSAGADLASVVRSAKPGEPLVAVLYPDAATAAQMSAGDPVDVTVQTVPEQTFGTLRGTVLAVGRAAESAQQITAFLGDAQLAQAFTAKGQQPVPVVVRLHTDAHNASGYAWSKKSGPPYALQPSAVVSASVRTAAQHPIDWLLP